MDNVITFPRQCKSVQRTRPIVEHEGCSTGYGYARRNRQNPLRQKLRRAEIAVVEVNKVDYRHSSDEIDMIRKGVEAARLLAEELARAAQPILRGDASGSTVNHQDQAKDDAVR